jgi:hypothetical protein
MPMVHLRVSCPQTLAPPVVETLIDRRGVVAISSAPLGAAAPDESVVQAALARESGDEVLPELRRLGVLEQGMVAHDPVDTAIGYLVEKAEREAPGEGADALIWDELMSRTGEDSTLTVAAVVGDWYEAGQSLPQLGINLVGIVVTATITLALRGAAVAKPRARDA